MLIGDKILSMLLIRGLVKEKPWKIVDILNQLKDYTY